MVTSCVVGGCDNKATSQSTRRNFLKFHVVPNDPTRRAQWNSRVHRLVDHVRKLKTYKVCSDHFDDADYNPDHFRVYKLMGFTRQMKLELKNDAIPNTNRSTSEALYYIGNGFVTEQPEPKKRKVTIKQLNEMDEFSSSIDTTQFPYTPQLPTETDRQSIENSGEIEQQQFNSSVLP